MAQPQTIRSDENFYASDDEGFLGFPTQNDFKLKPTSTKQSPDISRVALLSSATSVVECKVTTSSVIASSTENNINEFERKLVAADSHLNDSFMLSENDIVQLHEIHRNSQDFVTKSSDPSHLIRPLFFKIVLGDFCQFSSFFPYPHHQCTAMAAAALAFNTIKSIVNWNANDLNDILLAGQTYYKECLENLRFTDPSNKNTFLEAINLNENLTIASQNFEVFVDLQECHGGAHESRDILAQAFSQFELKCFANGILTYKGYAYAILRYRNSYSNGYFYVFFDSHGRNENGEKVIRVTGNEGRSAILFFDSFIDFFFTRMADFITSIAV